MHSLHFQNAGKLVQYAAPEPVRAGCVRDAATQVKHIWLFTISFITQSNCILCSPPTSSTPLRTPNNPLVAYLHTYAVCIERKTQDSKPIPEEQFQSVGYITRKGGERHQHITAKRPVMS